MTRSRTSLVTLALVALAVGQAAAQESTHTVKGVVFDSIAGVVLPGAIVQVVQLDSASQFTTMRWWGTTDTHGHFKIARIPVGRFAFGFQHDALGALGIRSPLRVVDLSSDTTIDLAIPRGAGHTQHCAPAAGVGHDVLAGKVLDAATNAPLDSVKLDVDWIEVERDANSYRTVPHHLTVPIAADGSYRVCGVAGGSIVNVAVTRDGYRDIRGRIFTTGADSTRRDFHLSSTREDRGTSSVAGRVLQSDSVPVSSGRVLVPALKLDVPIVGGRFTLSQLPPGTWLTEVRALGFEPDSVMIDAVDDRAMPVTIVLAPKVQALDPVVVLARSTYQTRKLQEILTLKKSGFGTFFMPGDERLASADRLSDLAEFAAGFHVVKSSVIEGRVDPGPSIRDGMNRCHPTFYINGFRNDTFTYDMTEVLAVAMYPDLSGVPVQWRDRRTHCVIAIWTK